MRRAGAKWLVLLGVAMVWGAGCSSGSSDAGLAKNLAADTRSEGDGTMAPGAYPADVAADMGGWWHGDEVYAPMDVAAMGDSSGGFGPGYEGEEGNCAPACEGMQCGPDGCGGSCGWCSAATSCQDGVCVEVEGCTPECGGKMVGEEDGCGGVCTGGGFGIGLKPGGCQDVGYFRWLLDEGTVPEAEFFPIEGFLNEHDTPLPPPDYSLLVTLHAFVGLFYDPQADEPLMAMQLGLNSGLDPSVIESKPFNLVVVVDVSGSMSDAGKLTFVRSGLQAMLDSLDGNDTLAIVTYSSEANIALGPTAVSEDNKGEILDVINGLTPGGSTNLYAGMVQGYEVAAMNLHQEEAMHRIMLLSDGVVSAGESDEEVILAKSAQFNAQGIGITTIGVGTDFNFGLMYNLANQGNGNFYFLDDGDKLLDVFQHELEYLLTPVADNLKISFRLPEGFFVEDIYGFDFEEENGEVKLLGPSPQYSVEPEDPEDPNGNNGNNGNNNGVAVSTLYASKKNGLLMVKIGIEQPDVNTAWQTWADDDFAEIAYSYDLVNEGTTEVGQTTIQMGTLTYFAEDAPGAPMAYLKSTIMQRNFCILRAALAIRTACTLYHQDPADITGAISQLADASTFCNGVNLVLEDEVLDEDVALMTALKDAICDQAQCQ